MLLFRQNKRTGRILSALLLFCLLLAFVPACTAGDGSDTSLTDIRGIDPGPASRSDYHGKQVDKRVIGPGLPPPGWKTGENVPKITGVSAYAVNAADIPALSWSYGCTATSAAMYFGYYDRNGYPDLYTGSANGGVFPLTNEIWGSSPEGDGECPLSASHTGIDGRVTKGHVDDYYYSFLSNIDPYSGNWQEHSPADSLGDFMGTSQYENWQNLDGSTTIFFYRDGSPLEDYTGGDAFGDRDAGHGMKLFAESRGYAVASVYNQYIFGYSGNTNGFTYDQYVAEIDSGNPVLIHLYGHTMLGVGYTGTNTIIVHDTWDYSSHTMAWGAPYGDMAHIGVTVVHLVPASGFSAEPASGITPLTVQFTDRSGGDPASWAWDFGDGDSTNATAKNPVHTYTEAGTYTVTLVVSNAYGSDSET
ncbi:MAG: PKD domain-containing protein, partial [Methanoregulaceae archaeon]